MRFVDSMCLESRRLTDGKKSNEMTRQNNIVESCSAAHVADDGASNAVLQIGQTQLYHK